MSLQIRAAWLSDLLSTEPADRPRAESALRDLYAACGFPSPGHFFWFDSPFRAAWAVALLSAPHDLLWQRTVEAVSRMKQQRESMDRVRAELCQRASQPDWEALLAMAGEPLSPYRMALSHMPAGAVKLIQPMVTLARIRLYKNVAEGIPQFDDSDDLHRIEHHLRAAAAGQAEWSTVNPLIGMSFSINYSFSMMAMDEAAVGQSAAPPILAAAWSVARSAGPWGPFSRSV